MVGSAVVDGIEEWTAAQQRVIALVRGRSPEQVETRVPACPDWTVRDLFSHMVGLGSDVVAGDEPDDHNETWTRAQVRTRRGRDIETLVAEWEATAEPLRAWMRANGTRPLGDVTIHEQDLRGALGEPGAQDTPAIAAIRDTFAGRVAARLGDLPPIALVGRSWEWVSSGSRDDAAVLVRAPDYELSRAVVSRRSADQLRRWTERGDIEPYLDAFAVLGGLPQRDLTES